MSCDVQGGRKRETQTELSTLVLVLRVAKCFLYRKFEKENMRLLLLSQKIMLTTLILTPLLVSVFQTSLS